MVSGNFTGKTNNNYITPFILWSATPNHTTNKSDVTVTLQLSKSKSSSSSTYGTGSWGLNINGTSYSFSSSVTIPANGTYVTVATKTVTIDHNSDGTKQIWIGATGGIPGTSYTTTEIGQTVTLKPIPRASTVSGFSFTNGYIEQGIDFTISSKVSSYYHAVHLYIPDTSGTGFNLTAGARKLGGKHHINFTDAQLQSIYKTLSSKTSSGFTLYVMTYSDATTNTQIGDTHSVTANGNINPNVKPTITSFGHTINSGGLGTSYVQGKSTVKLTCAATMGDGAEISSYTFSGPNLNVSSTSNTATTGVITTSGTLTYTVTVTDTRGRQASATVPITVYPYATPKITSITAQRCLADGTLDNNGTYAKVKVVTSHSAISTSNKATVKLSNSKDSYKTETTVITSTTGSNTYDNVYGSGFLTTETYTIRATITDAYGASNTLIATLASAQRALNIAKYGNGISIGGYSTVTSKTASGLFECNWPMSVSNDLSFSKLDTEQSIVFNDGGSAKISTQIYKGAGNSSTVLGAWDITNSASIWLYGADRSFYINRPTKVDGTLTSTGTITAPYGRFNSSNDADGAKQNEVPLRIGNPAGNHIDLDGNEMIAKNGATALAELYLQGSALGFYSRDTLAMTIGTDATNAYVQSAPVYARTYTGAANMYVTSSGTFGRSTASSERYKKDIENVINEELDPYKILNIPVRQYKYNEDNIPVDAEPDDLYIGLVAEEVAKEYPVAAEYTEDGQIEMWNIKMLFPALLKIVQDQQKKIEALEEQINNKAVN